MPFGLSNAPSVFQQAMNVVLKGLIGKTCLAYLDDIIILARDEDEHARNLDEVLSRLKEHNFFCNIDKCQFAMTELKYLGHVVTADTVQPDPYKVEVLQNWPASDLQKSANHVRSFLGLAGYFRRFIPKFPTLAAPLQQRITDKDPQEWTLQCDESFRNIKQALVNATKLRHPNLNKPFHIYTDASDYAYGAVLTQEHDGKLRPVAWVGKKLNKSERNYYTLEKELGAIVFAHRQWRCYLENNQPVFIHSDHNPLRFLQNQKNLTGKHARWLESLSRIDWRITYIPGDKNVVADAVSRATHLSQTETSLHDGLTISAEQPMVEYKALALTEPLARRDLLVARNSKGTSSHPMQSLQALIGTNHQLMGSQWGCSSTGTPADSNFSSELRNTCMSLQTAVRSLEHDPRNPFLLPLRNMWAEAQLSLARADPRMVTPPTPQAAAGHKSPARPASRPQTTVPSNSSWNKPLPQLQQPLSDLELDTPAKRNFQELGTTLQHQHDSHLSLDVRLDEFWDRLRKGYAHDPAFAKPPPSYRFDKHLKVFFQGSKLVVPEYDSLRKQILLWHHTHPWHAHMGVKRTQALITDSFHWPGINDDIKKFISQCHSCQLMKSSGQSDAMLSPLPIPTACWRIVSLDMITQLPKTTTGFDCIVVFVDQFSKMARLIPSTSTLDGPGFAKLFFQHIYPHYGLPLGICSDRGVQWNNKFFKAICDHMGVKLDLTYSYHPRANGQVERFNRVIEEALRHFISPAHDNWDMFIPHVEFSLNSSRNQSTGCTAFQLNRITPPLSPTALAFDLPEGRQPQPAILHRMYYSLAKVALSESKQSMWSKPEDHPHREHFQVGNNVLLSISKIALHHPSLRRKFTARWVGPCKILELVGTRAARIQLPATLQKLGIHDVFHFSALKPFVEAHFNEHEENPQAKPDTDTKEVFEVEAIIDYKRTKTHDSQSPSTGPVRGPQFLVRWKGYSEEHDTWLPPAELKNCLEAVATYLFQNASAAQRDSIIAQFPRASRQKLTCILQRAQGTTSGTHRKMSGPPRTRTRSKRLAAAATVIRHHVCSCCSKSVAHTHPVRREKGTPGHHSTCS